MQNMESLRYKPSALWRLDGSSPFADLSGYGRSGTRSGTESKGVSLTSDAVYSQVFDRSRIGTFSPGVYLQGRESEPFTLTATVDFIKRTEDYAPQPYLENLATVAKIQNLGNATITQNYTWTGVAWTRIQNDSGGHGGRISLPLELLEQGQTYSIGLTVANIGAAARSVTVDWCDRTSRVQVIQPNSAFRFSFDGTTEEYTNVYRFLDIAAAVAGSDILVKDLVIIPGASKPTSFFNGNTPGCEWAGTPGSSVSRTRRDVSQVNFATNPTGQHTNSVGWSSNHSTNYPTVRDTTTGRTDSFSVRGYNVLGNPTLMSSYNSGMINGSPKIEVSPGEVWTESVYLRPNVSGVTGRMHYIFYGADGVHIISPATAPVNLPSGTWTRLSFTITIPDNVFFMLTMVSADKDSASVQTDYVHADDFLLQKTDKVNPYFDGNSVGASWAGTAGESASLMHVSEGPVQVLSNSGQYDGLSVESNKVSFSTRYTSTGEARCEHELDKTQKIDIAGVHTRTRNSLYVNGELVSEVDISPEQQADTYASSDPNLYSGNTQTGSGILANNYAAFARALGEQDVRAIFDANRRVAAENVSVAFGGQVMDLSRSFRTPDFRVVWDDDIQWRSGTHRSVAVDNGQLVPDTYNGKTVEGTWQDVVVLYQDTATPIQSVDADWSGKNVKIEASVDFTNWVEVKKNTQFSNITSGFNPAGRSLFVRATFTAGVDEAYLDNLQVNVYTSRTAAKHNGRQVTYAGNTVSLDEHNSFDLNDDWGVKIGAGGSITIGPAPDGSVMRSVGVWIKTDSNVSTTFNVTAANIYQNGVASTYNLRAGEWTLYHLVLDADSTGILLIDTPGTVGEVTIYNTALTAAQITQIYEAYTGLSKTTVVDGNTVRVSEPADSALIYTHEWEIVAS